MDGAADTDGAEDKLGLADGDADVEGADDKLGVTLGELDRDGKEEGRVDGESLASCRDRRLFR